MKGADGVQNDEVRKKLTDSRDINVSVRAARPVRSGVVIETLSEAERRKLCAAQSIKNLGLSVTLPRKVGPKVLAFDVPKALKDDDILTDLCNKNTKGIGSLESFKNSARIINRRSKKESDTCNVVIELSSKERGCLLM